MQSASCVIVHIIRWRIGKNCAGSRSDGCKGEKITWGSGELVAQSGVGLYGRSFALMTILCSHYS